MTALMWFPSGLNSWLIGNFDWVVDMLRLAGLRRGDGFLDEVGVLAQRTAEHGLQAIRCAVRTVHAELLNPRPHQAHVVGKPGRRHRGHLSFEGRHVLP